MKFFANQSWLSGVVDVGTLFAQLKVECFVYDRYAWRKFEFELELDTLGVTIEQVEHPRRGQAHRGKQAVDAGFGERARSGDPRQADPPAEKPVLISVMSAAIERDAFDNRWFSKRKAVNRIDALEALTMGVGRAAAGDDSSVYEQHGLLLI